MATETDDSLAQSILDDLNTDTDADQDEDAGNEGGEDEQEDEGSADEDAADEDGGDEDQEDGQDDDQGEDESQDEPPRGRAQARIRRLQAERAELKARLDALERGQGGSNAGNTQQQPPPDMRKQIRDDLAKNMDGFNFKTPAEQADIVASTIERVLGAAVIPLARSQWANADKQNFRDTYGQDAVFKKLAPKVEEIFNDALSKGFQVTREQIYIQELGKQARQGLSKHAGAERRQREIRRTKATATSAGGRGDAGGRHKGDRASELEKRLDGVKI